MPSKKSAGNKNGVKALVVLGAGASAREVLGLIEDINRAGETYEVLGLFDDDPGKWNTEVFGYPVLGPLDKAREMQGARLVPAMRGIRNFWRAKDILNRIEPDPQGYETLVHPTASISPRSQVGRGVVIFPHVTIGVDVRIGNHVDILPGTVVNHDSRVGDYSILASGVCVSGRVVIGESCYLGSGSRILQDTLIEGPCIVGLGSVVLKNVPPNSVVAGNPARILGTLDTGNPDA
ncbi:MAG: sugar O-acyltransferase [Nitrospinae bacterium CG11_big_fil_rev_8_21_14_0_20_56_8]|nr:MAG: sugar O-acyltransferase [Nitrospinae bacterium CG11_big_fil_rev_8_21_14_0_20_56_8]